MRCVQTARGRRTRNLRRARFGTPRLSPGPPVVTSRPSTLARPGCCRHPQPRHALGPLHQLHEPQAQHQPQAADRCGWPCCPPCCFATRCRVRGLTLPLPVRFPLSSSPPTISPALRGASSLADRKYAPPTVLIIPFTLRPERGRAWPDHQVQGELASRSCRAAAAPIVLTILDPSSPARQGLVHAGGARRRRQEPLLAHQERGDDRHHQRASWPRARATCRSLPPCRTPTTDA